MILRIPHIDLFECNIFFEFLEHGLLRTLSVFLHDCICDVRLLTPEIKYCSHLTVVCLGCTLWIGQLCSSTELLALAEKHVVVEVANGAASGLRFDFTGVTVGWEECVVVSMPNEFEQIEKWCLPPHFKNLDHDLHSLLMWPLHRKMKQRPDIFRIGTNLHDCSTAVGWMRLLAVIVWESLTQPWWQCACSLGAS